MGLWGDMDGEVCVIQQAIDGVATWCEQEGIGGAAREQVGNTTLHGEFLGSHIVCVLVELLHYGWVQFGHHH